MTMRRIALPALLAIVSAGCTMISTSGVRVESGNQSSGFLSRPMSLTLTSDEAVRDVAQRLCDGIRPGSDAHVEFVGKIPSPEPLSVGDWGRYRYDCVGGTSPAKAGATPASTAAAAAAPAMPSTNPGPIAPSAPAASAPSASSGATSPATGTGAAPAPATGTFHVTIPVPPPPSAAPTSAAQGAAGTTGDAAAMACLRHEGTYHLCMANCLLAGVNGSSLPDGLAGQCRQQCGSPRLAGCN